MKRPPRDRGAPHNRYLNIPRRTGFVNRNPPGNPENREKFLSGLQALDGVIPEIRHMEIHRSCKPGNPYDACLIADFDDLDALSRYKNDPRHVAVSTLCKSIRESRGAIDYEL